jgi:short-subunit dehydrogenase
VLCPGATETEFAKTAGAEDSLAFKAMTVPARGVAEYGYVAMLRGKRVAVPGLSNKFLAHVLLRMMPRRVVTWISRRTMEKM